MQRHRMRLRSMPGGGIVRPTTALAAEITQDLAPRRAPDQERRPVIVRSISIAMEFPTCVEWTNQRGDSYALAVCDNR
jgi:hypothetical protein